MRHAAPVVIFFLTHCFRSPFLYLPLPYSGHIMRTRLSTRQATVRSTQAAAAPRPRRARARSLSSDDDGVVNIRELVKRGKDESADEAKPKKKRKTALEKRNG